MNKTFIIDAKRTPMGAFNGQLKNFSAAQLGSYPISAIAQKAQVSLIDHVFMGCVIQAGLGQSAARQASILGGLSHSVPATTINKVCGSSLQTIISGVDAIQSGRLKAIIAGGVENMSNAPYLLPKAREGYKAGHHNFIDSLYKDGLEDAFSVHNDHGTLMGVFAEELARKYNVSREDQEAFAKTTYENYQNNKEHIQNEIIPIHYLDRKGNEITINSDEPPTKVNPEKFSKLRPAFDKEGTITAATSSSIADGAAAVLLMGEKDAANNNLEPLAQISGIQHFAQDPKWFAEAPVFAIENILKQLNWHKDSVDLFEINEAFAIVPMAAMKHLDIERSKINVFGGACTLGHPLGCSGARIVVTLINALKTKKLKRGIASACIGGGEAIAIAIEVL